VSTPASDPATNADEFALQSFEHLQEATAFVREFTGKNIACMKRLYDSAVKPQSYEISEKVLVYNPKKHRGKFAKWEVQWTGPFVVENKLNQANYVVKKGRGKPVVIHIDRLRKLPTGVDTDNTGCPTSDSTATSPPAKRRKADIPVMATGTPCAETASCTEPELSRPVTCAASRRGQRHNTPRLELAWVSALTFCRHPKVQMRRSPSQPLAAIGHAHHWLTGPRVRVAV